MSEIEAIKKYLEWAEERRIAGEPHSVEAYEEAMRVADLETRLAQIRDVIDGKDSDEGKLFLITTILYPVEQSA